MVPIGNDLKKRGALQYIKGKTVQNRKIDMGGRVIEKKEGRDPILEAGT